MELSRAGSGVRPAAVVLAGAVVPAAPMVFLLAGAAGFGAGESGPARLAVAYLWGLSGPLVGLVAGAAVVLTPSMRGRDRLAKAAVVAGAVFLGAAAEWTVIMIAAAHEPPAPPGFHPPTVPSTDFDPNVVPPLPPGWTPEPGLPATP